MRTEHYPLKQVRMVASVTAIVLAVHQLERDNSNAKNYKNWEQKILLSGSRSALQYRTGQSLKAGGLNSYSAITALTKLEKLVKPGVPLGNTVPPPWPCPWGLDKIKLEPPDTFLM